MEFYVGDTVVIRSNPKEFARLSRCFIFDMSKYCGQTVQITHRQPHSAIGPIYKIDLDNGLWWWDAVCFQEVSSLQEIQADELLSILG